MDDRPTKPPQKTRPEPSQPTLAPGSRRRLISTVIIGLVALLALAWWMQERPATQTRTGRFNAGGPTPVVAEAASKSDVDITINALGTVTSLATVTIFRKSAAVSCGSHFTKARSSSKATCAPRSTPDLTNSRWRSGRAN